MNLETAISRIQQSFAKMNEIYHRTVFDEIAIVGLEGGGMSLVFYDGPSQEDFKRTFADKTIPLRNELTREKTGTGGEFGFTREGERDLYDAYICLGPGIYLFCNNTAKSMREVTEDPRWLEAQATFLHASQHFANDPVAIESD